MVLFLIMDETNNSATATATATAAPAAATAPTVSTSSAPAAASPAAASGAPATESAAGPNPATEALSSDASANAMVEYAKSKGLGDDLSVSPKVEEPAVPAAEADPAAVEAEPAKEPEATAQTDPDVENDGYTLEEDGFVGARDLATKIDSNEALKAALPPEIRNEIMANARLAEKAAGYESIFASPEEAKIVAQTAEQHASFAEAFNLVNEDIENGTSSLIQKLIEASAVRDAEGNPMKREDGSFITTGTASKFLTTAAQRWVAINIVKKIEASGDENAKAALDLVMESAGLRPSTAEKANDQDPVLAARKAELDAQEARIRTERETSAKQVQEQYTKALDGDLESLYETETGKLLGLATGLDSFTKAAVEQRLEKAIRSAIKSNTAYQMRRNQIKTQPYSAERRQQEVALAREFFRSNLARIARPILTEAGVIVKGKIEARQATQAARAQSARSEINGGAPAKPGTPSGQSNSPAMSTDQAKEAFKAANGGKEPSDSELNIYMMLTAAKAKGFSI